MVEFKPHILVVAVKEQNELADGTMSDPYPSRTVSIACFAEPMTSREAFEAYGVQYRSPVLVMCEVEDGRKVQPNSQVELWNRTYWVQGQVQEVAAGDECDHSELLLDVVMNPVA